MGVGGNSVISMVVKQYHSVEKAKIKPKSNIKATQKSSRLNSPKESQKAKLKISRPRAIKKGQILPCVRPNGNPDLL